MSKKSIKVIGMATGALVLLFAGIYIGIEITHGLNNTKELEAQQGPTSSQDINWLINKPISIWDYGIMRANEEHDSAEKKMSVMINKPVIGGFSYTGEILGHAFSIFEIKADKKACDKLWEMARYTIYRTSKDDSKKEREEKVSFWLNYWFSPKGYSYNDRPDSVGKSLVSILHLSVSLLERENIISNKYEGDADIVCSGKIISSTPEHYMFPQIELKEMDAQLKKAINSRQEKDIE